MNEPTAHTPSFAQSSSANRFVMKLLNAEDPLPNFEKNAEVYNAIKDTVFRGQYPSGSDEDQILNTWLDAHSIHSSPDKIAASKTELKRLLDAKVAFKNRLLRIMYDYLRKGEIVLKGLDDYTLIEAKKQALIMGAPPAETMGGLRMKNGLKELVEAIDIEMSSRY
jgi:hypothetical protein